MKNTLKIKQNFTLVELLIVIAIIGVLASLLVPALKSARGAARQATCINNQKQIGLAIMMYTDDNDQSIPHAYAPGYGWGWDSQIRVYLGGSNISGPWGADDALDVLLCPSAKEPNVRNEAHRPRNSYVMPAYENSLMAQGNRPLRYSCFYSSTAYPDKKTTDLPDPSGTLALTEMDYTGNDVTAHQGSGAMVYHAELQAGEFGNGYWANPNAIITTLQLHNKQKVNFLLADGHVESHRPYSSNVIGAGTPTAPEGMWTPNAGD